MGEQIIQITEGAGKKLHTFDRTIGANTVNDEVVLLGEPYLASYTAVINGASGAAAGHLFQIMAGAGNRVRIRQIRLKINAATAAGALRLGLKRLTTAGTGGGVITPNVVDPADGAATAACMTLPTATGTLAGDYFFIANLPTAAAAPQAGFEYVWPGIGLPNVKPVIIAAGTSNGLALVIVNTIAGSTVDGMVQFDETSF